MAIEPFGIPIQIIVWLALSLIALLVALVSSRGESVRRKLVSFGRWKCVCPGCNGTGLCVQSNALHSHSCDGDCSRVEVPWDLVPDDFDGSAHRLFKTATIGVGWIYGSFWMMLRFGWWPISKAKRTRELRFQTYENLLRFGSPTDLLNWRKQIIEPMSPKQAR